MSLRSMTGYGHGAAAADGLRIEAEISTVNRKQLDIQLTLPPDLKVLESRIVEEIGRSVHRGRVLVEVVMRESSEARRQAVRVDEKLADSYARSLRRAARKLGLPDNLGADVLLKLPGVVQHEPVQGDLERIWPILKSALAQALGRLVAMREREGRHLSVALLKLLDGLERRRTVVAREAPKVAERYRAALRVRLERAGLDASADGDRLERELVLFADKSDITEETARLESHLAQARSLLKSGEPTGRALDFLAQEMFREINTIGSKANDARIAGEVVSFKAELERWREQVQNIE